LADRRLRHSLAPEILAAFERTGSRIERHPPGKDATDLELALDLARRLGGTRIRIVAGLGGRLDQTLGNLLLMAQATAAGLDLALSNGPETIRVLRGPGRLALAGAPGDTVSLLPIGGDAIDVTLAAMPSTSRCPASPTRSRTPDCLSAHRAGSAT